MRFIIEKLDSKNALWKGILISFLLHIFFGSLFQLRISLQKEVKSELPKVSFLGAILPQFSTANLTKVYTFKSPTESHSKTRITGYKSKSSISPFDMSMEKGRKKTGFKKETVYLYRNGMEDLKDKSVFFLPVRKDKEEFLDVEDSDSKVYGSLKRNLVYKPDLSSLKDLLLLYPNAGNILLKVTVVPEGRIHKIVLLKSSGKPVVDIAFKNYLRKWLFVPIHTDKVQQGIVKLNLSSEEIDIELKGI